MSQPRKPRQICSTCGARMSRYVLGDTCKACKVRRRAAAKVCPGCLGRKDVLAKTCKRCWSAGSKSGGGRGWEWLAQTFDRDRFAALMKHAGWDEYTLGAAAGLSWYTIATWLNGTHKPRRVELDLALRALATEPCGRCGGLGRIDPTMRAVGRLRKLVAPVLTQVATVQPWRLGSLVCDPSRRRLELSGASVRLSPRELELVEVLRQAVEPLGAGQLHQAVFVGRPLGDGHAIYVLMRRLRAKLSRIGAQDYLPIRDDGCYLLARPAGAPDRMTA